MTALHIYAAAITLVATFATLSAGLAAIIGCYWLLIRIRREG